MKHFIYRIGLISLLLTVAAAGLDYFISWRLANINTYYLKKMADIIHENIHTDGIIIGSSRAFQGINPQILNCITGKSFYNIAMDGYTFNYQYNQYRLLREHGYKPTYILQNVDYLSTMFPQNFKDEQFLPFFWDKAFREFVLPAEYSFAEKFIPMTRYWGHAKLIQDALFGLDFMPLTNGYTPLTKKWNRTEFDKVDSISFECDPKTAHVFEQYLNEVRQDGIKLIFVYVPVYREANDKVVNMDEMYNYFNSVASIYDIPILDYTQMPLDTTYFANATHLNVNGATLFSTRLALDLESLGIFK